VRLAIPTFAVKGRLESPDVERLKLVELVPGAGLDPAVIERDATLERASMKKGLDEATWLAGAGARGCAPAR
jgi:hypothetical protein